MTWKYHSATFHGSKASPQPGHYVDVHVQDDADPEAELHQRTYRYTYDGTMAKTQFVAMVKQEIKAHIAALNAVLPEGDATSDFEPE